MIGATSKSSPLLFHTRFLSEYTPSQLILILRMNPILRYIHSRRGGATARKQFAYMACPECEPCSIVPIRVRGHG